MAESRPGFEEHARLAHVVEQFFRQATNKFAVPDAANCAMVAMYLLALRQNPKQPKPKVVLSGKRFLFHLEAERREIEEWVSLARAPQCRPFKGWLRQQQELLDRIDQMRRSIEWMLPILWAPKRDPIRLIADVAKQAWQEANNGNAPKSANADDPVCKFVVAALAEIGQQLSAAGVSEVLRYRRRIPKDGQKR